MGDGVFCGAFMVFASVFNSRVDIRRKAELRSALVRRGATLGAKCKPKEVLLSGKKDEWLYEPGDEGRPKHRWKHDYAGFVPARNGSVGKCPNHMTRSIAQKVLNDEAVPVYEGDDSAYPDKFYAVYKGVVYEAVPTRPGISWHACPWRGDLPGRKGLPGACYASFTRWPNAGMNLRSLKNG